MPPFWPCFLLKNAKLPQCTGMILRAASEITAPSSFSTGMDLSTFKKKRWKTRSHSMFAVCKASYCWLFRNPKKISWYGKHLVIYMVFYIPGGAGFLASTVSSSNFMKHPTICMKQSNNSLNYCANTCQVKLLLHQDMHSKHSSLKPKRQWPPPKDLWDRPTFLALDAPTVAGSGFLSETYILMLFASQQGRNDERLWGWLPHSERPKQIESNARPMKFHINIPSDDLEWKLLCKNTSWVMFQLHFKFKFLKL